jgi:hypothetical protein
MIKGTRDNLSRPGRTDCLSPLQRTRSWRRRWRCRFRELGQGELPSPLPGAVGLLIPDVEARAFQREPPAGPIPGTACAGASIVPVRFRASSETRQVPHRSLEARSPAPLGARTPDLGARGFGPTSPKSTATLRPAARFSNQECPSPFPRRDDSPDTCGRCLQLQCPIARRREEVESGQGAHGDGSATGRTRPPESM